MFERRSSPRTLLNETGSISVDEHRSLPCMVYDRSTGGVRITLPEAEIVPDRFVLSLKAGNEILICQAVWRKLDEIGASTETSEVPPPAQSGLRRDRTAA